jgi:hypothetical protein
VSRLARGVWRGLGRLLVAACTAAVLAGLPSAVSAAAPSWTLVPSPNPSKPDATLADVTCTSATDCWAVGYDLHSGKTLIEHNTGTGWVIVASPNPTNRGGSSLLTGVSCISVSECWAVGNYINTSFTLATLVEHYNGTSWTVASSPNPGTSQNELVGIRCLSATSCWAVGDYFSGGIAHTLIEQYTGGSWTVVSNSVSSAFLKDVACLSLTGECWAVGYSFGATCVNMGRGCTLIEHNTGSGWVTVSSPNAGQGDSLNGLTCMSATDCWAVGAYTNAGKGLTLTEHYDGNSWTVSPSPSVGSKSSNLSDVSCASAGDCWAVGSQCCVSRGGIGVNQTLIEHNAGSGWLIVTSPQPRTTASLASSA